MKEFLSQKGVDFTERDIVLDPESLGELEALGVMTTPVTVIGKEVIVGFDKARLEHLLDRPTPPSHIPPASR
ncbi:MAG: glutaredoxin family protein [Anaerolineae bacterium]